MQLKVARLNSFARLARPAVPACLCASAALALVCAAAPAATAQIVPDPQNPQPPVRRIPQPPTTRSPLPPIMGGPPPAADAPTMKKPEPGGLPSRPRRSYDAKHDVTYVNVPVTLLAHTGVKDSKGAFRFGGREVLLTFQLAYRGRQTYDIVSAFLILESTTLPGEPEKLSAARQLEINADPYEYAYERLDYQTEQVAPDGAATQQLRKEIAAFKLPPEDLRPLTNAGRLLVKFGAESFLVKSPQLSELRRTLLAGADR